jgi:hypothetical protein
VGSPGTSRPPLVPCVADAAEEYLWRSCGEPIANGMPAKAASTKGGPCLKSPSGPRTRRKVFQDS